MERDYASGKSATVEFFTGTEIEHTPAFGMKTLFVTGLQPIEEIKYRLDDAASYLDKNKHIHHVFFGANHSFQPPVTKSKIVYYTKWDTMIRYFLSNGYWCSLDIPLYCAEDFLDLSLVEQNNFIPQIRVPIPHIRQWNHNTMLKIDDIGFNKTNPGVWTHRLDDLQDISKFTDWNQYKDDEIL